VVAKFELIELTSGNVAGDYATEQETLEHLRHAYETHGASAIADLSLMKIENGEQELVAMQEDLVHRVVTLVPPAAPIKVR
jgi:hypothetical protein